MRLIGKRIYCQNAKEVDASKLLDYEIKNRERHEKISNTPQDFYTLQHQHFHIQENKYFFLIIKKDNQELIGTISLDNLNTNPTLSTTSLSYTIDKDYEGQAYMSESLVLILDYCFDILKLHRIEVLIHTENIRSEKLLKRFGFSYEGLLKENLRIHQQWTSHKLYALLEHERTYNHERN